MYFYSTNSYESKVNESLDHFAEKIANYHAESDWDCPQVKHLSIINESEIQISLEGLRQFRERVEEYYFDAVKGIKEDMDYQEETRTYIYNSI